MSRAKKMNADTGAAPRRERSNRRSQHTPADAFQTFNAASSIWTAYIASTTSLAATSHSAVSPAAFPAETHDALRAAEATLCGVTIFSHHFAPCSIKLKLGVTIEIANSQVKLKATLTPTCGTKSASNGARRRPCHRPTRSHTVLAFPTLENATSPDQSIERAALSCWNMRSTGRPRSRSASRTSSSVL